MEHYDTSPGLSWVVLLKKTAKNGVDLEYPAELPEEVNLD